MKKQMKIMILLAPCLFAQLHYWVDADGVKHYSAFPPADRGAVTDFMTIQVSQPVISRDRAGGDAASRDTTARAEEGEFVQEDPVLIFTTHACPKCAVAVGWCKANGIQYRELNIHESAEYRALYEKMGGLDTPYIIYGNRRIMGWNQDVIASWFDPGQSAILEEQLGVSR